MAGREKERRGARSADMKVDTRYNLRNYASAYFAGRAGDTRKENAKCLGTVRLRKVAYAREEERISYESSDVNALGNLTFLLFFKPQRFV